MVSPAQEVDIDERLVRALLVEQHPDLADLPLAELDAGWDNALWRIGDTLLARLPRRAIAAPLAVNEQRWLPMLSPRLPLPVSVPIRVGRPSRAFAWSWSIVRWLDGVPGDRSSINAPLAAAEQLGGFLCALHSEAPPTAPSNPCRGVPLADRASTFDERITDLSVEVDVPSVREVWERACNARPWSGPKTWIHGDLHPANVLVANGVLAGIIDFGDMCGGDPATDLAAAWMLLPLSAVPTFARAYGGMDANLEARALGWAILFGLMLLAIGPDDRPTYEPFGRGAIANAIEHTRQ